MPRPITEPGKGSYWVLDISSGEGYKRERKRRNKKAQRQALAAQGRESESESVTGDEEGGSDTSSICRSESPSTRAGYPEMGPSRMSLRRHASSYAQNEGPSARIPALARSLYPEPSRTLAPPLWITAPADQTAQGQYLQPQPFRPHPPSVLHATGQAGPILPAIGWQAQQQMRQHEGLPSVSAQMSYTSPIPSVSSSMSGNQGQVHAASSISHAYGAGYQGLQSASRGGQFQGIGEEQILQDHNAERAFSRQGSQDDHGYYGS